MISSTKHQVSKATVKALQGGKKAMLIYTEQADIISGHACISYFCASVTIKQNAFAIVNQTWELDRKWITLTSNVALKCDLWILKLRNLFEK